MDVINAAMPALLVFTITAIAGWLAGLSYRQVKHGERLIALEVQQEFTADLLQQIKTLREDIQHLSEKMAGILGGQEK